MPAISSNASRLRARMSAKNNAARPPVSAWSFVNSAFALWLFSSIFITFGSWVFTVWKDERNRQQQVQQNILRLDAEIASRFYVNGTELDELPLLVLKTNGLAIESDTARSIYNAYLMAPSAQRAAFPEYRERGLISLFHELAGLLKDEEKACVLAAIRSARYLQGGPASRQSTTQGEALNRMLEIADYRWRRTAKPRAPCRTAPAP